MLVAIAVGAEIADARRTALHAAEGLERVQGVVQLVGYATTGNPQGANDSLGNTSAFRNFDQNTTTSSVFGQVGLDVTDRWKSSLQHAAFKCGGDRRNRQL